MSNRRRNLLLVPRHDHRAVLTVGTDRPRLPSVGSGDDLAGALAAAAECWDVRVAFLRTSARHRDAEHTDHLLEFASLPTDTALPLGAHWLPLDRLSELDIPEPLAGRLADFAAEQAGAPVPPLRAPWAREGWYGQISAWTTARLLDHDVDVTGPLSVVQQWGISAVLRQPTDRGPHYVKAVFGSPGRGFWHEPAATTRLRVEQPDLIPEVLAVDTDRGWMLMTDMGLAAVLDERPLPDRITGIEALGDIHRHWAGRGDTLLGLGCPDRRPHVLADRLPELAGHELLVSRLDDAERAAVTALLPRLTRWCERADTGPVPMSLVHGDCHLGNIGIRPDGAIRVYDWSDAAWGHPFWDVTVYTHRQDDADRLRDAYLAGWRDTADPAALRTAMDDARVLGFVYLVDSYLGILTGLEPGDRFVFADSPAVLWRAALSAAEHHPEVRD